MEFWYELGLLLWRCWLLGGCRRWRWLSMEEDTAAVEEVSTEVAVGADFMVEAEDLPAATLDLAVGTLASAVDILIADIVAGMEAADTAEATTAGVAIMVAAVMDGAAEVGAADMVTVTAGAVGAGDLVMAGLNGDMAGANRKATTATAPCIMRPSVISSIATDNPRISREPNRSL